jgi:ATP-dependent Clp protease ATP-binding subunit ClpX
LDLLGEDDLLHVLTAPPDSIVREFRELLSLDEIELEFTEDALREVVRYSMDRGLGARGLRSILEHVMSDVMFEAPERRRRQVRLDGDFVRTRLHGLDSAQLSV